MVHDLVALPPLLEEVDPGLVELLAALVVERSSARSSSGRTRTRTAPSTPRRPSTRKVDSCSENSRSNVVSHQAAHVLLAAPPNGLPAPSGGGGRNGRIIANIWASPPSGVQQPSAMRPPGFVTRASSDGDRRVIRREHHAARRDARRRSSRPRRTSPRRLRRRTRSATPSSFGAFACRLDEGRSQVHADDVGAALAPRGSRHGAGSGGCVEDALPGLRIRALDDDFMDVANRVRHRARTVPLPHITLCRAFSSANAMSPPWSVRRSDHRTARALASFHE